jgi:nucleotide-binding universal stress UspA family protein/galactitol-specific phosphotransferase system IIB component
MGLSLRIILCVVDSEIVYKMAQYISMLAPDAEFHLLSVIYPLRSRALYTKLYNDETTRILSKALETVESILRRNGATRIYRKMIGGKPSDTIVRYARQIKSDLIALTPSTTPTCKRIGRTAGKVIEKSEIPILLYTLRSHTLISKRFKILRLDSTPIPSKIMDYVRGKYSVETNSLKLEDITDRITTYDLIVMSRETFRSVQDKYLCDKLWAPILIIPASTVQQP